MKYSRIFSVCLSTFLALYVSSFAQDLPDHPGYEVVPVIPEDDLYFVGGMDFLSDGRLVVCTWDGSHGKVTQIQKGDVFIFDGVLGDDPSKVTVTEIASDLDDPLGLKVVDDRIFVLLSLELVELVKQEDGQYVKKVINSLDYGHSRHEFQFGLAYKEPYFYGTSSTAQQVSHVNPNRGTAWKIHEETGERTLLAAGLREPNGVGLGLDGALYVTDNQGSSVKHCKLIRIEEGAHYGYDWKILDSRFEDLPETPPAINFAYGKVGKSASEPLAVPDGIFAGQFYVGDVTWEGIRRAQVEIVDGTYQGCAFPFFEVKNSATNRLIWGPDGNLYVGSIGKPGNWPKRSRGFMPIVRVEETGEKAFEMKAVYIQPNGFRISFTKPIDPTYVTRENFTLERHEFRSEPKDIEVTHEESSGDVLVSFNEDFKTGLYDITLSSEIASTSDEKILHTHAHYQVNKIGTGQPVGIDPQLRKQHFRGKKVNLSRMGDFWLVETHFKNPYSLEFLSINGSKVLALQGDGKDVHAIQLPKHQGMLIMQAKSEGEVLVEKVPVY